jgi:6-phosphogluconolactonase (cycloisomerase 2 family)
VRQGRLIRATCFGQSAAHFALAKGRHPLPVSVQFVSGALRQCAEFGSAAVIRRRDGGDGRLLTARNAAAPATCGCDARVVDAKVNDQGGVKGLEGPTDVTLSPDGRSLYVANLKGKSVVAFKRDAATGLLAYLGTQTDGVGGATGLDGAVGIAASPDGKHVYVSAFNAGAVVVFARKPSGALAFVEAHRDGQRRVEGLGGATGIAVSPDGTSVYATGQRGNGIAIFARDRATGRLRFVDAKINGRDDTTKLTGPNSITVSADGLYAYVTALTDDSLVVFRRDPATGRLAFVEATVNGTPGIPGLDGPNGLVISPDGRRVYVGGAMSDTVTIFDRSAATGRVTFVDMASNGAARVTGLDNPSRPTLTPDGACLFVGAFKSGDVAIFTRTPDGTLRFVDAVSAGQDGVQHLEGAAYSVSSPDGRYVYALGQKSNAVVVLRREARPPQSANSP